MLVYRKINDIDVAVDINTARDIFFTSDFIKDNYINNTLEQNDVMKILSKNGFRPIYLVWEIIDKCNFSCEFCYIVGHSNNKLVRFESVKGYLSELIDMGLTYCLLTGGEVTYHKDFKEIYRFLKENGVFVEIYTNGYNISQDIIELFKEYPPYLVEVSLYGISDAAFRRATGTQLNSNTVLRNVISLKENGVNIKCKTALNSLTLPEFEEIRSWCKVNEIEHYHSTSMTIAYDGKNTDHWRATREAIIKYDAENELNFRIKNGGKAIQSTRKCFSCSVGAYGVYIDSKFNLMPCSSFNSKNTSHSIYEKGLSESISDMLSYVNTVYHKPISGCSGCSASNICKMCPALADEVLDNNKKLISFATNEKFCSDTRARSNEIELHLSKYDN